MPVFVGLAVVVSLAQGVEVVAGCGAVGPRGDVVDLAVVGGPGAAGQGAGGVAGGYVVAEAGARGVGVLAAVQEVSGSGVGDEAPPGGVGSEDAGKFGVEGAVAGEVRGIISQGEQGGGVDV